jgi:hypothetical protein
MRYMVEMNADNRSFAPRWSTWAFAVTSGSTRKAAAGSRPHAQDRAAGQLGAPSGGGAGGAGPARFDRSNDRDEAGEPLEILSAKKALENILKTRFEGKMFHRNYGWALPGVAVLVAALWLSAAAVALSTGMGAP